MTEKELQDYQRLWAAGCWPAASDYREAERRRFRAAGHSKEVARRKSWDAMLSKSRMRWAKLRGRVWFDGLRLAW